MTSEDGFAIQKADFDRMAEGNLEAASNEEPRASADRTSNEEALLITTGGHHRPLNIRTLMYFRMGLVINLTYQYIYAIMVSWESMGASRHPFPPTIVIAFAYSIAFNIRDPFGVPSDSRRFFQ
jgi:hypothetical protein